VFYVPMYYILEKACFFSKLYSTVHQKKVI